MSVAIIAGSSGLIGSEAVSFFHAKGFEVAGIDNNMREYFFGTDGSVDWNAGSLKRTLPNFTHYAADIRSEAEINRILSKVRRRHRNRRSRGGAAFAQLGGERTAYGFYR